MAASRSSDTNAPDGFPTPVPPSLDAADCNRRLAEVLGLLESAPTPEAFFAGFFDHVLHITRGSGAAVWELNAEGRPRLLHSRGMHQPPSTGDSPHARRLAEVAQRGRALWLPADTGARGSVSLVAPLFEEQRAIGLLEIAVPAQEDRQVKRYLTRLATELAALVAAYLHRQHWQQLQQQQSLWQQLETFVVQLHQSLDPREVAYLVANEGKRLLGCDQCSVGLRPGRSVSVAAVSGAVRVESHSPLVRSLRDLFHHAAAWGEPVVYSGLRDETLPPAVASALDAYLAQSSAAALIVLPLRDERRTGPDKVCGLLAVEGYDRSGDVNALGERLELLRRHVAPALANAVRHDRLPFRWLTGPLADLRDGGGRHLLKGWAGCVAVALVVAALLVFVPLPLRSEATGQLVPRERRIVYAPLNGKVVQLAARHGDLVDKGQELLFIEDLETQLKVDQLFVKISALNQRLAFLDEQLSRNLDAKERTDFLTARIQSQYDLHKAKVERNLYLAEVRNPRKAPVGAPLAGQVVTFDAAEKLVGKTVKVGEPLLRIAEVGSRWEVELLIPERGVGRIREALLQAPDGKVDVQLLLSSDPNRTYTGTLALDGLGGETVVQNNKVVLPARVEITDRTLAAQLERMPVGVEVQARVQCGRASAGYVWFSELWDFVYERFVF